MCDIRIISGGWRFIHVYHEELAAKHTENKVRERECSSGPVYIYISCTHKFYRPKCKYSILSRSFEVLYWCLGLFINIVMRPFLPAIFGIMLSHSLSIVGCHCCRHRSFCCALVFFRCCCENFYCVCNHYFSNCDDTTV